MVDNNNNIPREKEQRENILREVEAYVIAQNIIPPLGLEELQKHAKCIMKTKNISEKYKDFITILINNELWRETVKQTPYERRFLLLPQCFRDKEICSAALVDIGLLCNECGKCPTGDLQDEADELNYVSLIAEGTTAVTKLLEQGKIDAVIGVSCMSVLERSFPYMANDAIPGIAIPLYKDGCENTKFDIDWVRKAMRMKSDKEWKKRIQIDTVWRTVKSWFEIESIEKLIGIGTTMTEKISYQWLAKGGKRWRPVLFYLTFKILENSQKTNIQEDIAQKLCLAIECFHKASLIHDDIEDDSTIRYGDNTLHNIHGTPIALNIGDFLVGEGYRLISSIHMKPERVKELIHVASKGHKTLCLGQGEELFWTRNPYILTSQKVLEIFEHKTVPAFEVALCMGVIAKGHMELLPIVKTFTQFLGTAYQISDDWNDFQEESCQELLRPSLITTMIYEKANGTVKALIENVWLKRNSSPEIQENLKKIAIELDIKKSVEKLFLSYKNKAISSLSSLKNKELKILLHRIVGRILSGI